MSGSGDDRPSFEMACYFGHDTGNAVQITDPATGELHWIPLSQVLEMHKDKMGHGTIVMTAWIARQKGITK